MYLNVVGVVGLDGWRVQLGPNIDIGLKDFFYPPGLFGKVPLEDPVYSS